MGCQKKSCDTLSEKQLEVLKALASVTDPCGSKDIAASTSLEAKQVSSQITALKKKGFVDSPVRCKYSITAAGKAELK